MLSVVPSPMVSMLMAASPNLTRFGSSFLKAGSSFFLRKGDDSVLPLARPLLPPSLSQLSQSLLRPQPPMRQSTDILAQPLRPPAGHKAQLPDRPSRACLRPDYIELPPPASKCSRNQSIINGFNVLCGVGILTTSYGIKEGGWSSLLLLPLLGASSCYTGLLMKRCIDSSPNIGTYPDIGQAAFGVVGRIFVSVCIFPDNTDLSSKIISPVLFFACCSLLGALCKLCGVHHAARRQHVISVSHSTFSFCRHRPECTHSLCDHNGVGNSPNSLSQEPQSPLVSFCWRCDGDNCSHCLPVLGCLFWVALILPCACYLSIKKGAVPLWEIILCIVIIMIGAVCACVGSYTSVSQMISNTR